MRAESKTKQNKPHPRHPLVLTKLWNIFLSAVASCFGAAVPVAFSPTSILSMRSAVGPVLAPPSASAPWFASLDVNALPSECILRQVPSQSVTPIQPSTATEINYENICTVNILTYADAVAASRLNEVVPQNKLFRSAYLSHWKT